METKLELLAPAKNMEQGIAAINHGADAVYIGAPLFGARVAAGNAIQDIEKLTEYAHLYGSKTFATVNTLLFDNELEKARQLIWSLYNIGVDAIIVQDMGLLEMDLPPIELHASTQTHNTDPRRVKFLEQVGFKRIILARETSLEQMTALRKETSADLEAFIQGALCVCYSGQCYLSLWLNGRSGNRGACSQPCRSAYDLINATGKTLRHNEHLLSLKDFSATQHLESMIKAGITSFKIEGRLKDISYVKNVTAYYRQKLDKIMEGSITYRQASSGKTQFFFTSDLERTFNRGFTDYFLAGRQKMASPATQKSLGKQIGKVVSCNGNNLVINSRDKLTSGDGICFFNADNQLEGFLVNQVEHNNILANKPLSIKNGTVLWRNNDFAFEKQLQGDTAERKIAVSMTLDETATGLKLLITDEDGCSATAEAECEKIVANNPEKVTETNKRQLSKLGGTPFQLSTLNCQLSTALFIPASLLNELRRQAVETLQSVRIKRFHPKDTSLIPNELPYFENNLNALSNVINEKSEAFYHRHHVNSIEPGLDKLLVDSKATPDAASRDVIRKTPLMTCKYCLRYEMGQCLKHKCNKEVSPDWQGNLFLLNNGIRLRLRFNCQRCEMQIFGD